MRSTRAPCLEHLAEEPDALAQPGPVALPDALLLEQRFIVREGPAAYAFVAEGNRAVRRTIAVRDLGNSQFGVESGLKEGDAVLLPQGLKDGARIKAAPIKN